MKKILLGTTALVAAAGFAGIASAQQVTTKATSLSISGNVEFEAAYADSDAASADRKVDFLTDADLTFSPKFVADNGLTTTGRLDYDATSMGTPDEMSVTFAAASFGSLTLGNDDGAADNFYAYPPLAGDGNWDGSAPNFVGWASDAEGIRWAGDNLDPNLNSDSTKIYYSTGDLDLAGFKFGASYTPKGDNAFNDGDLTETAGTFDDLVDVGAAWSGEFSGVSVDVTGVYITGSGVAGSDDPSAWNAGANLGFGAFKVGGSYTAFKDVYANNTDGDSWALGATYDIGAFTVGATYTKSDYDAGSVDGTNPLYDSSSYGAAVSYTVAPGVTAKGEINQFKNDDLDQDATVVMLGTQVDF